MKVMKNRPLRRLVDQATARGAQALPKVSFEFFPPKNPQGEAQLWATVKALEPLLPQYVSVTYGAGGTTREATYATVKRIIDETYLRPAAHLTCVGQSQAEIGALLRQYWSSDRKSVV